MQAASRLTGREAQCREKREREPRNAQANIPKIEKNMRVRKGNKHAHSEERGIFTCNLRCHALVREGLPDTTRFGAFSKVARV